MKPGLNQTVLVGAVVGEVRYGTMPAGDEVLSFTLRVSRRPVGEGKPVQVMAKINVYIRPLIDVCRRMSLERGMMVVVDGELMNRKGPHGLLLEVRAHEIIFP